MKPNEMITYTLKKLNEGLGVYIPKEVLDTCKPNPSAMIDWRTQALVMKIAQRVPVEVSKEYDETVQFEVPDSWWDHLKKELGFKYKIKKLTRFIHFECGWKYPNLGTKLNLEGERYMYKYNLPPLGEEE